MNSVIAKIEELIQKKDRVVVAIDGNGGAGKTTAAAALAERFGGEIIHMDDFFLPPALRTPERLAETGGNIHYERFLEEVVRPLRDGRPVEYRVFDCGVMDFSSKRKLEGKTLLFIEGSYALHPLFCDIYDLRVFAAVPPAVQRERILARSGAEFWQRFESEWIPMENRFFDEMVNFEDVQTIRIP